MRSRVSDKVLRELIVVAATEEEQEGCGSQPACPSEAELARYVEGRLSWWRRRRLRTHVARCERCWEGMTAMLEMQALLPERHRLSEALPSGESTVSRRWGYVGLVGAAATLAAVAILVLRGPVFSPGFEVLEDALAQARISKSVRLLGEGIPESGRGFGFARADVPVSVLAFRLGVLWVDVRVARGTERAARLRRRYEELALRLGLQPHSDQGVRSIVAALPERAWEKAFLGGVLGEMTRLYLLLGEGSGVEGASLWRGWERWWRLYGGEDEAARPLYALLEKVLAEGETARIPELLNEISVWLAVGGQFQEGEGAPL